MQTRMIILAAYGFASAGLIILPRDIADDSNLDTC